MADAGIAVWSLEYRRVGYPGGGWPGTFRDVARGADQLRDIAAEHDLDLSRVIAVGHSAGGQLALWLAARHRLPRAGELFVGEPLRVKGVVALAPAAMLEELHRDGVCNNVVEGLLGGSPDEVPERYRLVSPLSWAPLDAPISIVVGGNDDGWRPGSLAFARAALRRGQVLSAHTVPGAGHFDLIAPNRSTFAFVLREMRRLLR